MGYQVIDIRTQKVMRTYGADEGRKAHKYANMLDQRYGAVRYVVKLI